MRDYTLQYIGERNVPIVHNEIIKATNLLVYEFVPPDPTITPSRRYGICYIDIQNVWVVYEEAFVIGAGLLAYCPAPIIPHVLLIEMLNR